MANNKYKTYFDFRNNNCEAKYPSNPDKLKKIIMENPYGDKKYSVYEKIVRNFMKPVGCGENQHSPAGKQYLMNSEHAKGYYWFYENDKFIVDIHNFRLTEDMLEYVVYGLFDILELISTYSISASGEWLDPYQTFEPNTMFFASSKFPFKPFILHKNSRYFAVGVKLKKNIFEDEYFKKMGIKDKEISKVFFSTQGSMVDKIKKIAYEILDCKMDGVIAEMFFDAKVKEWIYIAFEAYKTNLEKIKKLSNDEEKSLEIVARYIEDHYALDLPQELLQRLATMSKTKLKDSFKIKYNMSITEFIQRKRINAAENLLLSSDISIREIARAVGYNSASRFSTLYKRYKGISPKDVRIK